MLRARPARCQATHTASIQMPPPYSPFPERCEARKSGRCNRQNKKKYCKFIMLNRNFNFWLSFFLEELWFFCFIIKPLFRVYVRGLLIRVVHCFYSCFDNFEHFSELQMNFKWFYCLEMKCLWILLWKCFLIKRLPSRS